MKKQKSKSAVKEIKSPIEKKKTDNRRSYPRFNVKNLWVKERSGEFEYLTPALNISEGGVLLDRRFKTTDEPSVFFLHKNKVSLQILAQPLEERSLKPSQRGTAYCFLQLSELDKVKLKTLIKAVI